MNFDYKEKKILIFGTGGSGKTYYAVNDLWRKFRLPFVYDVSGDFKNAKGGINYYPSDIDGEFMDFLRAYVRINQKRKIDALFFDDSDVYIDYAMAANPFFKDLVVRHRNKGISLVFISKRPQNLPTLVVENFHIVKIFQMEGKNAIDRLNDMDHRLVDLLGQLKQFEHIHKVTTKEPVIIPAVRT